MFFIRVLWIFVALHSVHQAASQYGFSLSGACPSGMVRTTPECFCAAGRYYSTDTYCVSKSCSTFFKCTPPNNSQCDGSRCVCTTGHIYVPTVNELDCVPLCTSDCGQDKACDGRGTCTCGLSSGGYCVLITCPSQENYFDAHCKGLCERFCQNGKCDRHGTCMCDDGFYEGKNDGYACHKVICPSSNGFCLQQCAEKCRNGRCDRNGTCHCENGFNKDPYENFKCDEIVCPSPSGYCRQQCKELCRNGKCKGHGVCQCNEGFHLDTNNFYNCKEIFCPSSNDYCLQKCEQNCRNGNCIRGGVCQCGIGFKNHGIEVDKCNKICPSNQRNDLCRQQCEINCTNGSCDSTGRCLCNTGFTKDLKDVCIPIACPDSKHQTYCRNVECAKKGCENGKCNKGISTCDPGMKISSNNANKCERIEKLTTIADKPCISKCILGVCFNGQCFCREGYKLDGLGNETEICRPICSRTCADNETCSSPENCTCVEGFHFDNDRKCVPICRVACTGGFCVGMDQCRCLEGFVKVNGTFCRKKDVKIEGGSVNEEAKSEVESLNIAWIVSGTVVFLVVSVCFCFVVRLVVKRRKRQASKHEGEDFKPKVQPEARDQSAVAHEYLELLPENVYANVEEITVGISAERKSPSGMQTQSVIDYETPLAAGSPIYDRPYDHVGPKRGQTYPFASTVGARGLQAPTFCAPVPPSDSQIRQLRE